jgi:carbon monoxide dehydrogenase subunit G
VDITGTHRIPAPRKKVWAALNDPEILTQCIPGCESLEAVGNDAMKATVVTKVGPVKAKFTGDVTFENVLPPESYRIVGEGKAGIAGFAKGYADVILSEVEGDTILDYKVDVVVGGKIAQLGSRLIVSTAKKLSNEFFNRFVTHVS